MCGATRRRPFWPEPIGPLEILTQIAINRPTAGATAELRLRVGLSVVCETSGTQLECTKRAKNAIHQSRNDCDNQTVAAARKPSEAGEINRRSPPSRVGWSSKRRFVCTQLDGDKSRLSAASLPFGAAAELQQVRLPLWPMLVQENSR